MSLPPLPEGATLDTDNEGIPPLPSGATLDGPGPSSPRSAATEYYGPDPNEPDQMVDPKTMQMVKVPRWKAAQFPDAQSFMDAHTNGTNAVAGFGKSMVDTGKGLYQLAASIGHAAGMVSDEKMAKIQKEADERHEVDAPLMATTAGKSGFAAGEGAQMAALGPESIVGSAVKGAAVAGAQPTFTGGPSRLQNAGRGAAEGAAGAAVGKTIGAGLSAFGGTTARQPAIDVLDQAARDAGVGNKFPLDVAQRTGSKGAQTVIRASGITSGAPEEFAAQQAPAFNRIVLARMGVTDPSASAATPEVLGPGRKAITDVMNDVADRTNIHYDSQLENDLAAIGKDAPSQIPVGDLGPVYAHLDNIVNGAAENGGSIPGTLYQKLNTSLGKLSSNQKVAPVVGDIQEALNDAFQRSAAPADQRALGLARQQYRAMKQIEPAVDPSTGNISPSKLINSMSVKSNRNQALYGQGDQSLMDIARAGKQIIPDTIGNSGTAERALPALTAMEVLASGDAVKAGIKSGVGVLGLNAAGRAMRNQGAVGNYLSNGAGEVGRAVSPIVKKLAPSAAVGAGDSEPEDIQRATGGKVDHEALVSKLINRWKSAKRETDKTTKPLLKVPDAAIVKALDIAGSAI